MSIVPIGSASSRDVIYRVGITMMVLPQFSAVFYQAASSSASSKPLWLAHHGIVSH